MVAAREVRRIRAKTGLAQADFAKHYRFSLSRLRDWEQGRHAVSEALLIYLRLIACEPEAVERVLTTADR
jgi:putative transcriptional regulator